MARAIGYYTNCNQGQELVNRFGEYDLNGLPQIDQAALLAILGQFVYQYMAYGEDSDIKIHDAAEDAINPNGDETTNAIQEAIAILDGINSDDAIRIIRFLVQ